eukprot:evm.model.scf_126.4 EVM.evm.TU.scf_126.4   scf_126:87323-93458(+)
MEDGIDLTDVWSPDGVASTFTEILSKPRGFLQAELCNVSFVGNTAKSGGAVAALRTNLLSMSRVNFSGNVGGDGAALYIEADGDLDPQQFRAPNHYVSGTRVSFVNNSATRNGGAVFLRATCAGAGLDRIGISPVNVSVLTEEGRNNNEDDVFFEKSEFVNNSALKSGGAWRATTGRAGCRDCQFEGNFVSEVGGIDGTGGALSLTDQASFHGRGVTFRRNSATNGGCVHAENSLVDVVDADIDLSRAQKHGGGIYIHIPAAASFRFGLLARVSSARFRGNFARVGGGLYFLMDEGSSGSQDPRGGFMVLAQSAFMNNAADMAGGAIFTNAPEALDVLCNSDLRVIESLGNDTRTSRPGVDGIQRVPPVRVTDRPDICGQTWSGNSAAKEDGGNVLATTAVKAMVCKDSPRSCVNQGGTITVANHTSGGVLEAISVELIDAFGRPAFGQSTVLLRATTNETDSTLGGAVIAQIGAKSRLTSIRLQGSVNRTHNFTLSFDPEILPSINIEVHIRSCLAGEFLDSGNEICLQCPDGRYSFGPSQGCFACPPNSDCRPSTITPKEHFWHSTSQSTQVHECILKEACKYNGRDAALRAAARDAHANGTFLVYDDERYQQCRQGHRGVLCGACDSAHGKSRSGQCTACGGAAKDIVLPVILVLWFAFMSAIMSRNALVSAKKANRVASAPINRNSASGSDEGGAMNGFSGAGSSSLPGIMDSLHLYIGEGRLTPEGELDVEEASVSRRGRQISDGSCTADVFKVLVNFLQVTGIAIFINASWTSSTLGVLAGADFLASGSHALFSLECAFPSTSSIERSVLRTIATAFFPFALFLAFIAMSLVATLLRTMKLINFLIKDLISFWHVSFLAILYISFIDMTRNALKVLDCAKVDEEGFGPPGLATALLEYWTEDTGVECYKGRHLALVLALAIPTLALVSLGMPLWLLATLRWRRGRFAGSARGAYAFIYQSYRDEFLYWEVVVMMRKGLLAAITVFRFSLGTTLQATLALIVLDVAVVLQLWARPFVAMKPDLNRMETISLLSSILVFFAGIILDDPNTSTAGALVVSVLMTVAVMGTFLYLLIELVSQLLKGFDRALISRGIPLSADSSVVSRIRALVQCGLSFISGRISNGFQRGSRRRRVMVQMQRMSTWDSKNC